MSRIALAASLLVVLGACTGCSKKTDSNQSSSSMKPGEMPKDPSPAVGAGGDKGAVPAGEPEERYRLKPDEGQLAVNIAEAKAGAETAASIVVTPGKEYKLNTEFPTKVTIENADGVTIAKAELKAGGQNKEKGDADEFTEGKFAFTVKLTPAAAGSTTVKGVLKFAVCDKAGSTCLPKKEPIAIQVAAK